MNTALLERLENARWAGKDKVDVKVSELDAMIAEIVQLRQDKLQMKRSEQFNDNEKLVGFLKLETLEQFRRSKVNCGRLLRYQSKPYFIVPVYVKLSTVQRLMQCPDPFKK